MPYTRDEGFWSRRNWIVVIGLLAGIVSAIFGINFGEEIQLQLVDFIEATIFFVFAVLAWWSKQSEKTKLENN